MNGEDLLASAGDLLDRGLPDDSAYWPRAVAFLLRLSLERQIDAYWARGEQPAIADSPMRSQLLCLGHYAGAELTGRVRVLWAQLSEACHYHCYELAPVSGELRRWHDELSDLTARLALETERRTVPR